MFITDFPPVQFINGDLVNPEGLNQNLLYTAKAIQQTADKEICRWTTTYSMCPDVSTPLTSANTFGNTVINIPYGVYKSIPVGDLRVTIESITIDALYQSTSDFDITVYGDPITIEKTITLPERDSSLAETPFNKVSLFNIEKTITSQLLSINVPAGTTITKMDITVGFITNKFDCGWYNSFFSFQQDKPVIDVQPYLANNNTTLDAINFEDIYFYLDDKALKGQLAFPSRWGMAEFTNIVSGTNVNKRTVVIPDWTSASFAKVNTAPTAIGMTGHFYVSGASPGDTIIFSWLDSSGSPITGWTHTVALNGIDTYYEFGNKKGGSGAVQYSSAANDLATDRYLQVEVTGGATMNRGYVYLIYQ